MQRPEMILFDYGNTLCYEPGFDTMRATREMMKHITANPDDLTAEQIYSQTMRFSGSDFVKIIYANMQIFTRPRLLISIVFEYR